jgi:hypothetical protein
MRIGCIRLRPLTYSPITRLGQLSEQAYHFQCSFGALDSFISYVTAGAVDGLFERIARQNAK